MGVSEETRYWDKQWAERTQSEVVSRNRGKFDKIISELWHRPHYAPLQKLDIGCGPAEHAAVMRDLYFNWTSGYKGIELSKVCAEVAGTKYNLPVEVGDIYKYENGHIKTELFLLLDTFEHIEFPDKLADKIKELAAEKFYVFGNIPLYHSDPSEHGGFEKPMDVNDVTSFLAMCGIDKVWYEVYGINGYPYLIWEGVK
jgi:hypothetical protein